MEESTEELTEESTEESKNNIFNIEGEDFSLLEVASLLIDRFGGQINHVDWPQKALKIESGSTIFDSSKIHSILDYNLSCVKSQSRS